MLWRPWRCLSRWDLSRAATLASFLSSGCFASAPDYECSIPDNKECPAGEVCIHFECHRVCDDSSVCGAAEACLDRYCQDYSQACSHGEVCADGWACNGRDCQRLFGNCAPEIPGLCATEATCDAFGESHYCRCLPGFTGDGITCTDIDECAGGEHDCDASAQCVNVVGSFACTCAPGLRLSTSGKVCESEWGSLAIGPYHGCGVRGDGTLWCWGRNDQGQLGVGSRVASPAPAQVGSDANWVQAAAGSSFTCAIRREGSLWCWGQNAGGQLGIGNVQPSAVPVRAGGGATWRAVAAGESHACGVQADGSLWCWGSNGFGQLGIGTSTGNAASPVRAGTGTAWREVSCGAHHTCALDTAQHLWCWGRNDAGQVGDGSGAGVRPSPVEIPSESGRWAAVSTGETHTCSVRDDGALLCWGGNGARQVDEGSENVPTPRRVGTLLTWSAVAAGGVHTCATRRDGTLWCWGGNADGQLGSGDRLPVAGVQQVGEQTIWQKPFAGAAHACALAQDRRLYCWGAHHAGQLGDGTGAMRPTFVAAAAAVESLASGAAHACAVRSDRTLWCWGDNSAGQVGVATPEGYAAAPILVGGSADWNHVAAGGGHTCALQGSGSLWCWGANDSGQLGFAGTAVQPTRVGSSSEWLLVAAGEAHTCGILQTTAAQGSLWCWGANDARQAGAGDATPSFTEPQRVGSLEAWTVVAAGGRHTCALQVDGSLWCWGRNAEGQVGSGATETVIAAPVRESTASSWIAIAVGVHQTCAVRDDSTLWCWGQVGSGSTERTPVRIGDGADWAHVTAGGLAADSHVCARRAGGTAWCWGSNGSGQLGDGTRLEKSTPVTIAGDGWSELAAGGQHTCGVAAERLFCWGSDAAGQRGDGERNLPVPVLEPGIAHGRVAI